MIRLENVSKYYVGNNEIVLGLRKINLEFTVGELVAITGESGSGKSTLLNVISGSDTYEEGELFIDGEATSYYDETDWERYRRENIGFIYQGYKLIDSYTVFENVNIALVIKGHTGDNTAKVMEYLDKVGIREHADKKATQLSSGQKQRLAIARALACETDIIVADEPTGNLDSENSAQIMKLLNSIAQDKLVFVVTHNYDEIEPYATRKIRMYDGEVAEDILLRDKKLSGAAGADNVKSKNKEKTAEEKKEEKKNTVRIIDRLNRKSRPVTFAFLLSFMVAVSASFYILLGSFFSNLDNTTSKVFDSTLFDNKDITRLIVMKEDGEAFDDEDVEEISEISRVSQVEKYDCLSETFYLLEENVDYMYDYNVRTGSSDEPDYQKPYTITGDTYMKSVTCIDEDDLAAGTMPESIYDIAVYSDDESIIGTTVSMYLGNRLLWGNDLAQIECTVTAVLKEETDQIYFSEKMGQMLCADPNKYTQYLSDDDGEAEESGSSYTLVSVQIKMEEQYVVDNPSILTSDTDTEDEEALADFLSGADYAAATRPILLVDEKLTGNEAIVSEQFVATSYTSDDKGIIYPHDFYNIVSFGVFGAADTDDCAALVLQQETSLSTVNVIYVSEEFFEEQIGYKNSTQMAVYIDDYVYTDKVISALEKKGYIAASVYRLGAVEYDWELVERKATSMFISLGAFVMIFLVGVFILGMIMNLGSGDLKILRLLGIERDTLNSINKTGIIINMAAAVILSFVIIFILYAAKISYVVNIVKYYRWYFYLVYAAAIFLFSLLLFIRSKARLKRN